jgi:uroporphyrinogen III methyltransferase/synthase
MVFLVGAGPGDPDLISVRGSRLLQECDAVVYDNLISDELIVTLPAGTRQHYVGKCPDHHALSQERINELLVSLAREGLRVVRLKGGDPFVFGRGGEEVQFLREQGVPFEVVPGVSAGVGVPAYAGIPLTDRRKASFVTFLTGHKAVEKTYSGVPWEWLGQARHGTLVIYMGVAELEQNVARLLAAGLPPETPAVAVERGTFPTQRTVHAQLSTLVSETRRSQLKPPALFIIGESVRAQGTGSWFEDRPLFGLRVMVLRPAGQARPLYTDLRNLGAEVLPYPTIQTEAQFDRSAWDALKRLSGTRRWLILTSENGVRYFLTQWQSEVGDIRRLADFRIAAVGQGTRRALCAFRLTPDFVPDPMTSNALVHQLRARPDWSGTAVVRVRGNLESDRVERDLAAPGATVLPLRVYRTVPLTWSAATREKLFAHPPDVILTTSASSVAGLSANLSSSELESLAAGATIAAIGPSTSEKLRSLGLPVHVEAQTHTIPALIEALLAHHRFQPIKPHP